jgi:hypothetical protein
MRLLILSFSLLLSCGKFSDKNQSAANEGINQNEEIIPNGDNIQGVYAAPLNPLNKNIHMNQVGIAAVQRDGDTFSALVKMKYGQRGTAHKQAIYTGRRCPTIKDDLNKDAYVDIQEALSAIGHIVIPLDSAIDSQQEGFNDYPAGDTSGGKYYYQATTSFERMFSDLKRTDENLADNMIKLGELDGLTFPGRIILLQGINPKHLLPPSAASTDGETVHQSMPIACGVLWKVNSLPEEFRATR